MLKNPDSVSEKYVFGKMIGKHLIYKEHIDPLGMEGGLYFFSMTDDVRDAIKRLPILLKFLNIF